MNKVETFLLRLRGTRWFGVQRLEALERTLRQVIDVESNFNFRPYSHIHARVIPNLMFLARSAVTQLRPRSSVSIAMKNLLAVPIPTGLLSSQRRGTTCIQPTSIREAVRTRPGAGDRNWESLRGAPRC